MEKKYFTKYLSVEGKIKDTDLSITEHGVDIHSNWIEDVKKDAKKVKLFLCSRDIQVGDKVYREELDEWTVFANDPGENHKGGSWGLLTDVKHSDFKVIGEVSKNAIWVKEGDEFDEENIDFLIKASHSVGTHLMKKGKWYYSSEIDDTEKSCFVFDDERFTDGNYYYEEEFDKLKFKTIIKFKCPTCNTFH